MTEVTKYPTEVLDNSDGWTNPTYGLNAHDGLCTTKNVSSGNSKKLKVGTFGFAIPAGSTINHVYIGFHAFHYSGVYLCYNASLRPKIVLNCAIELPVEAPCAPSGNCDNAGDREAESVLPWTVDILNNETFEFWFELIVAAAGGVHGAYVDDGWIRVVYTPPAPPVGRKRLGNGLAWRR